MKTRIALATMALAFTLAAHADTVNLTFVSTNGVVDPSGTYYVYPYNFSINGSITLTPLLCISFEREIYQGESWTAVAESLTTVPDLEAAWLYADAAANSADDMDDQLAAWRLFDPAALVDAGALTQLALAEAGYGSVNPADYVMYVPMNGTQSEGGLPQTFIGDDSAAVPEPESFGLTGLGLALLGMVYNRYRGGKGA